MAAPLDLAGDVVELLRDLIDVESVSGNEAEITDKVEESLQPYDHLSVLRDGNAIIARTELGRSERVVIAGHLDTVPIAGNLPSWTTHDDDGREIIWGRGACDMKGGVAVQLSVAAALAQPQRDITWVFYDNEEVEGYRNGLGRIARNYPELLQGSFAVLCEPTSARIEGGCQGTMLVQVELTGVAAHSARAWMGHNAIHDAGGVLQRLASHQPEQIEVDGLTYHEGLNATGISGRHCWQHHPGSLRCRDQLPIRPRQVRSSGRGLRTRSPERLSRYGPRYRRRCPTWPRSARCRRIPSRGRR